MTEFSSEETKSSLFDPDKFKEAWQCFRDYLKTRNKYPANHKKQLDTLVALWQYAPYIESALYQDRQFTKAADLISYVADPFRQFYNPPFTEEASQISQKAIDLIEKNILQIDKRVRHNNSKAFALVTILVNYGSPTQQHLGLTVLGQHMDKFSKVFTSTDANNHLLNSLAAVVSSYPSISTGDENIVNAARKMSLELLKGGETNSDSMGQKILFLTRVSERNSKFVEEEALPVLLERYNLPPKKIIPAWRASTNELSSYSAIADNLKAIAILEAQQSGICAFLNREYDISDFDRYPTGLLLQQFREYDNTELPYGVIFYPRDDYNGAFYYDRTVLEQLYQQLQGKYLIRIFEVGDKVAIARALRMLERKYGTRQKISFLVIGGHGETDNITFGKGGEAKFGLFLQDLLDPRILGVQKYLIEHPALILHSCSTGFKGGIGQELSKRLNATVIAPDQPTSPKSIVVEEQDGKLHFSVEYKKPQSTQSYAGGQQVTT